MLSPGAQVAIPEVKVFVGVFDEDIIVFHNTPLPLSGSWNDSSCCRSMSSAWRTIDRTMLTGRVVES